MNFLKRLFKREIEGDELKELLSSLGKSDEFIKKLYNPLKSSSSPLSPIASRGDHISYPYGQLNVKLISPGNVLFDLDLSERWERYYHSYGQDERTIYGNIENIKKSFPYNEIEKSLILKKYLKKGKYLEKSLAVLSIGSILASAFFISNNITGNAILTNTANSSGIIGAGLFVFGLVSFILARNI